MVVEDVMVILRGLAKVGWHGKTRDERGAVEKSVKVAQSGEARVVGKNYKGW